jgi:hypothetical protein
MESLHRQSWLWMILVLGIAAFSCRKSEYQVDDLPVTITDNGQGTGTVTWTNNQSYLLEGFVFVNDGQVLTIEEGTVIRAKTGQGSAASALIVARGGRIIAEGTADDPIIFTAEGDDLNGSVSIEAYGLWGGIIILGNARINQSSGEGRIEGIPVYEPRNMYGGDDDQDDSGILRYVSIRHGGTNIGEGNEINGLTLGAVGNRTTIDHIEIISNADDGIEIFGGSVNLKNIFVAFCDDDVLDYDLGYHGKIQFIAAIQSYDRGDRIIEGDGGQDPVGGTPYSIPVILNGSFIGRETGVGGMAALFERNSGGHVINSVFVRLPRGVFIEYVEGAECSFKQFDRNNLTLHNNIFFGVENEQPDSIFSVYAAPGTPLGDKQDILSLYFTNADNLIEDPGFVIAADYYNLFPSPAVLYQVAPAPDDWFEQTVYKGAFYTYDWMAGWSLLSMEGVIN